MNRRRPPTLALWLLEQLGFARGNESLVGDLWEEFERRRSALWFWRQTLNVIATSVRRRAGLLQTYWLAILLGYAAQLPLSFLLYRRQARPSAAAAGWKTGAVAFVIVGFVLLRGLESKVFGRTAEGWKRILVQPNGATIERGDLFGSAALDSFAGILVLYGACCMWLGTSAFPSFTETAASELIWLTAGEATSEFFLWRKWLRESGRAAEKEEWELYYPRLRDLHVTLAYSDGTLVRLDSENCIETIFASANEELISALFRDGTSAERIRQAIWRANPYRSGRRMRTPSEAFAPVPLAEFIRLLRR